MPNSIVFFTTCADISTKKNIRDIEYSLCLSRIFSYKLPVYCVISESTSINKPFNKFSFAHVSTIASTGALGAKTKSQKEFVAIREFCSKNNLSDDTFVIKMTGRYLLTNDILVNAVKNAEDTIDAIINVINNDTQIRTFAYAFRWKLLKEYFNNPIEYLGYQCIETSMRSFLVKKKANCLALDELGVYADINNENNFISF